MPGGTMIKRLLSWFVHVPDDKRLVALLIWVDLLGAVYGFNWYKVQLSETRLVFWPIVPDSPFSTLVFGIMLVAIYYGRRYPLLEGISYATITKYGIWTLLIFVQAWAARGFAYWEEVFLFASHAGMALEALLFFRVFAPRARYIIAGGAWLLFNDYMDYVWGFHPFLPFQEHLRSISIYTPVLSLVVTLGYLVALRWANQGTAWFPRVEARRRPT
ncbi:MAG: DUF1405 domain-containing protein [Bacillota bacterium]|nr:DUF1405 domain-containing protein [Bacillota bacterium]